MAGRPTSWSPLAVLGIATAEQGAYRLLLRRAPVKVSEAPEVLRRPPAEVARLLASLAATGLVAVRDGTIVALPPEETLGRLVTEEKRRLADAQDQLEAFCRVVREIGGESTGWYAPPRCLRGHGLPVSASAATNPLRTAWSAAWVRLWTPSLSRMRPTCDLTVASPIPRLRAISLFA